MNNKNSEGYIDMTASKACENADKDYEKFHRVLKIIKNVVDIADFQIEGRIVLIDKKSKKIWR